MNKKYQRTSFIGDTKVTVIGLEDITDSEILYYLSLARAKVKKPLLSVTISPAQGDNVTITYEYESTKFERIRRITGYLVGTIDRWNNAKKSEEQERVKHI